MNIKLKDICRFQSGGTPSKTNQEYFQGNIPWITTVALNGRVIDSDSAVEWITEKAISETAAKIVPERSIMIGTRVGVGKVAINSIPMSTSQDVISLVGIDENKWNKSYLCRFLQSKETYLKSQARGATIKGIKIDVLANLDVPFVTLDEQTKIVTIFNDLLDIISARKQQLSALDDLIKARFVEMFGDPVKNPKGWEKTVLSENAEIKIGPFGSLLHKDDYITGGHALVNPSHIIAGQIVPDNDLTISDEKYAEMSAYHLQKGDVVMGRRGEMGRCAVVEKSGLLCGTGSLIIRSKGELSADFIQKIISFPTFKKTIEDMAVGQTMPNLNVPIVAAFQIIKPPKNVQNQYYDFIAQVDKTKETVKKSLEKTKLLFDSLMQRYFG